MGKIIRNGITFGGSDDFVGTTAEVNAAKTTGGLVEGMTVNITDDVVTSSTLYKDITDYVDEHSGEILTTLEEIDASTDNKDIAGALAVKALNSKFHYTIEGYADGVYTGADTWRPFKDNSSDFAVKTLYTNTSFTSFTTKNIPLDLSEYDEIIICLAFDQTVYNWEKSSTKVKVAVDSQSHVITGKHYPTTYYRTVIVSPSGLNFTSCENASYSIPVMVLGVVKDEEPFIWECIN